jgi:hypothetical protein
MVDFIDSNTLEGSANINTHFAKNATFLLFSLLILGYCLKVSDSHKIFTSATWALLQFCLHTFRMYSFAWALSNGDGVKEYDSITFSCKQAC